MEKHRITYYNEDGEASEAIVDGKDADDAISKLPDFGRHAIVESVGPAAEELPTDEDVNEGDDKPLGIEETNEKLDTPHSGPEGSEDE